MTIKSIAPAKILQLAAQQKQQTAKAYDAFISHVKDGTGELATTLNHTLPAAFLSKQLFLDVDEAFALPRLSEIASNSKIFVVLASPQYWTRPYCITEITNA